MTALKAANASFASIADTCLYVNDGPSPSCDYDTVT